MTGSWEQPGKSPTAAAFVLVLICGSLYALAGSVVIAVVTVATTLAGGRSAPAGLLAMLEAYYRRFQLVILGVVTASQFLLFLALPLILFRRWHTHAVAAYFGYARPRAADLALAALGAVAAVPVAGLLNSWVYFLFPVLRPLSRVGALLLATPTPGYLAAVVLAVGVTPAICEEALFRGYFQRTLQRAWSPTAAVLVSGTVFALFHQSPFSLFALVLVGCYLGFVYERSGSLYVPMTAHAVYNLAVIAAVNGAVPAFALEGEDFSWPVVAVAAAVLAAVTWVMTRRGRA